MKTLTVFTPSYNRRHTIWRTFDSLCGQTCKDFDWLVVDDGSTDGTRDYFKSIIHYNVISYEVPVSNNKKGFCIEGDCEYGFKIRYIYQENQGMHGAHNTAYRNINTELNTCIDSDDWMPQNAVEKIVTIWRNKGSDLYAGLVGLDVYANGEIVGSPFNADITSVKISSFYECGGAGDKKLVYRTDVINSVPEYPVFEGEKYVGLNYKYILVDERYDLLVVNEPLAIIEYQPDGSSYGMYRQYWNNPKGWMFHRTFEMQHTKSFKRRLQLCVHYVSSCIIAKQYNKILSTPYPIMTLFMVPFGIVLYCYVRRKQRK